MSEPFWNKISDLIGTVVKPNHLMLLITVVSGATLLNVFNLQENLNIQEDVNQYRFWIALAFVLCGGLQIFAVFASCSKWVMRHLKRIAGNIFARRIELSEHASIVLVFLILRRPDATRLVSEDPAVRELRLHELIISSFYAMSLSNIQSFELTERGLAAALRCVDEVDHQDASKIKEIVSRVTES